MSPRDRFPKPREYPAHYSISFGRGERVRTFAPERARRPSLHRSAARARLQRAGMAGDVTGEIPRPSSTKAETPSTPATARKNPLLVPSAEVALPAGAAAFAPITTTQPFQTL